MAASAAFLYTIIMANPLFGNAPQQILQAISGKVGTEQALLNQQAGFTDNQYSPQETVNLAAGRTKYALTYQQALAANTGLTGSVQTILMGAYTGSLTMSKIVTGS